jgi:uncharacterized repeat protein (TIGR02543 family)
MLNKIKKSRLTTVFFFIALIVGFFSLSVPQAFAGTLTSTNVEPATLATGATGTATVSFTTVNTTGSIPATGKIKVTFPAGFDVSGASGATCSTMDGSFATSISGQVVTITRSGGSATPTAATAQSCTINNIVNPTASGSGGTYTIQTTNSADTQIDIKTGVTADTFTVTWTGATNNAWATASNWSAGIVPVTGDKVAIPGGLTNPIISTNVSAAVVTTVSINSSGTGASLTITSGGSFAASGTITVNADGTFTMNDGTASIVALTNSGTVNISGGAITATGNLTLTTGTFTFSGGTYNATADSVTINGGTNTQTGGTINVKDFKLENGASSSFTQNESSGTSLIQVGHDFKCPALTTFTSTAGTVEKLGTTAGGGNDTYAGTCAFGTLQIDNTTGKVKLTTGTVTADSLKFISTYQIAGIWGSSASAADVSHQSDVYFNVAGTGTINVATDGTRTITYNGNTNTGGSAPVDGSSPYLSGSTVTVLGNTGSLVKTGYTFDHWNTAADDSGTSYDPDDTFSISGNVTLYAIWTANSSVSSGSSSGGISSIIRQNNNTSPAPSTQIPASSGVNTLPGSTGGTNFPRNLEVGLSGSDVRDLQRFLNTHGYPVALSGLGSLNNETNLFGALTRTALARFQAANGISPAIGFFGPLTRTFIENLMNGTPRVTPAVPAQTPLITSSIVRDLTLGMSGTDVKALQDLLIAQGYAIPAGATGFFGAQTKVALTAYQDANGITPATGYFGVKTRAQMKGASLSGLWW